MKGITQQLARKREKRMLKRKKIIASRLKIFKSKSNPRGWKKSKKKKIKKNEKI